MTTYQLLGDIAEELNRMRADGMTRESIEYALAKVFDEPETIQEMQARLNDFARQAIEPLLQRLSEQRALVEAEHVCDENCISSALAECAEHGMLGMADTARAAQEMTLAHLKEFHPRRAHHAIAKLAEELNQ